MVEAVHFVSTIALIVAGFSPAEEPNLRASDPVEDARADEASVDSTVVEEAVAASEGEERDEEHGIFDDDPAVDDEAYDAYAMQFLELDEHCHTAPVARNFKVVRGKVREPIDGRVFYEALGRDDLAQRHDRRRRLRTALIVSGAVLVVVAIVAGVSVLRLGHPSAQFRSLSSDDSGPLYNRQQKIGLGVLVGGTLGGVGMIVGGAAVPPHPIAPHEARALADEHNRELRRRLGLRPMR
jgi:hypothetical protein